MIKFLPNTDKETIVSALLSGQKNVTIDGIEIILKPLKRDTQKNREREADKIASKLIKLL